MITLSQTDNPILWQETVHQQRAAPHWVRWGKWIGTLMVVLAIGLSLAFMLNSTRRSPGMQIALYVIWIAQAAAAIRAIAAGTNMISREHVGQTWDALVLTGVSARQILFGKWRAALHVSGGWMLATGALRLAMLPVFAFGVIPMIAGSIGRRFTTYGNGIDFVQEIHWVPWAWMIAVVVSVVLTILDTLCCTALGLAASAITRRSIPAALLAISIRFAPVVGFAVFLRYERGTFYFWQWLSRTEFSLADSGSAAMMRLVLPQLSQIRNEYATVLPGLFLTIVMLSALLIVALTAAWTAIRYTGALPEAKLPPLLD